MGAGRLVFLVDADAAVRETIRTLVERFVGGVRVVELADGLEMIGRLAECRPDLILLEVGGHVADNLEALRALKADPATSAIPVVALGFPGVDDPSALQAGCDWYMDKHWGLDRLFAKVRSYLGLAGPS